MPEIRPPWKPNTMMATPCVFFCGDATARMWACTPIISAPWPTPARPRKAVSSTIPIGKAIMATLAHASSMPSMMTSFGP